MTRKKPPRTLSPHPMSRRNRRRRRGRSGCRFLYWTAVALPLAVTAMLYGYTDQAPRWLRAATESVDAVFGYPVLRLIAWMMS